MEMLLNNLSAADCCSGKSEHEKKSRCRKGNLAQAYVPMQMWTDPMEAMTSLACGTVFGELVMPYVKGSSLERNKREVCNHES